MTVASRTKRWLLAGFIIAIVFVLAWMLGIGEFVARQVSLRALSRRDYVEATLWANRAAQINGQDRESAFLLARLARKKGRLDEMGRLLKRAAALGIDRGRIRREETLALAQTGSLDEPDKVLPELLLDQQGDGREICEAFSNGFLIHGRSAEAKTLIAQWQQAYPEDSLPDVLLGRLSEFDLTSTEAERHYRDALRKNSKDYVAAYGLGRVLIELNRVSEAADAFRQCLSQSINAPAQYGLARCFILLGREAEAIDLLKSAASLPREVLTQAFKEVGESTEFDNVSLELGRLEANRQRYDTAVVWLERALAYNPKHRQAHYQLATTLQAAGRFDEAKPHFDYYAKAQSKLPEFDRLHDVVEAEPKNWEARYRLGVLALEVDSVEEGLFWLRSALALKPDHAPTHKALAEYYGQLAEKRPEMKSMAVYHRRLSEGDSSER